MTNSFLGTGWSFPPSFNAQTNSVTMVSDEADIQQSLQVLLSTRRGERVMEPTYGCNLDEMVFEPINNTFKTYLAEMIRTAILYFEARIDLKSVVIDDSQQLAGYILINIGYVIRTTNSRYNYVYPYYLTEGSN